MRPVLLLTSSSLARKYSVLCIVFLTLTIQGCSKNHTWTGDYLSGQPHGRGTGVIHSGKNKGNRYEGEIKNGEKHGDGTFYSANGDKYVGQFRDNERYGYGTYTTAKGYKAIGYWLDNELHGYGTISELIDGKYVRINDGNFQAGKAHGKFVIYYPPGRRMPTEYRSASQIAEVQRRVEGGGRYESETWQNGKKNGPGVYYKADGTIVDEVWKQGVQISAVERSPRGAGRRPKPPALVPPFGKEDTRPLPVSSGTGFAVSGTGHVVTNHHVVEGCSRVTVHDQERIKTATVVSTDAVNDLSLLQVDMTPRSSFPLTTQRPHLMQDIFVAGYPFGKYLSSSVKITKGIVSALTGIADNTSQIQIDAALQPGNSGGPIFDQRGNVVAVAVGKLDLKMAVTEMGVVPENTNFGIKANVVENLLHSNGVETADPNKEPLDSTALASIVSDATFYVSCWMTKAKIREVRKRKVLFEAIGE